MTQPSPSIPRYRAPVGSSTTARAGVGGAPAVLHKEDWEEMGSRIQFLDSPTGFKWIQVEPEAPVPDAAEGLTLLAEPVPHETKPESCCSRCLRFLPRACRVRLDASVEFS